MGCYTSENSEESEQATWSLICINSPERTGQALEDSNYSLKQKMLDKDCPPRARRGGEWKEKWEDQELSDKHNLWLWARCKFLSLKRKEPSCLFGCVRIGRQRQRCRIKKSVKKSCNSWRDEPSLPQQKDCSRQNAWATALRDLCILCSYCNLFILITLGEELLIFKSRLYH